jgi:RNA polymerase-binding protein DksA
MTSAWLDQQQQNLNQHKAELSERIRKIKKDIGKGLDADSKEQVIQLENQEVLDALGNEAAKELQSIESALQKIAAGNYGVCETCGEQIDRRRLTVRPYALLCMSCADHPGKKT